MDKYSVKFAGNDLSVVSGVDLYNHNFNDLPQRDIKINKIARRDKSIITSSEYSSKEITVWLEVCSGTRADAEDTLAYLKSLLQTQNSPLVVIQGGEETEYTATMNEFNIAWDGVTALVSIVFIASDPIGRLVDTETLAAVTGITTATSSTNIFVDGSSLAYPLISITVNAVTGGTAANMFISNGLTGQGLTITRTFTAGDFIEIDSENLTVEVNGSTSDFTGMFPQFGPGSQQIVYTDSFTTRTVDIIATYNPRFV